MVCNRSARIFRKVPLMSLFSCSIVFLFSCFLVFMDSGRKKLTIIFWLIVLVALAGAILVGYGIANLIYPNLEKTLLALLLVMLPLLLQVIAALGLDFYWFAKLRIRPGKVIKVFQWVSGALGIAGIYNIISALSGKSEWLAGNKILFIADGILIILAVCWIIIIPYLVEKDTEERKICEFC